MTAGRIMQRGGLSSDKPIDLFKVKPCGKGKPEAEGPLFACRALVVTQKRQGLYAMPCAGTVKRPASARRCCRQPDLPPPADDSMGRQGRFTFTITACH